MNGNKGERRARLAKDIRRQVGTEATKRLLRTLPVFRLEKEVPKRFKDLLDRLERLEGVEGVEASSDRRR
ncbi:hypothetical protein EH240_00100 [Mesorhizobium tamadayense]|uniref:Anti-sigma factor NepR domain-containing protein n=1 Tax=Mesorhizobium tamadayense TaxID=425306 RepID=A0A3P3G9Y4_9HYPH|nr:hypothetical protein [Mesorhizobium tamadayense]RRI07685.1 hypothetical protein EH240_00100 [Mesorhizobium tamadayense]